VNCSEGGSTLLGRIDEAPDLRMHTRGQALAFSSHHTGHLRAVGNELILVVQLHDRTTSGPIVTEGWKVLQMSAIPGFDATCFDSSHCRVGAQTEHNVDVDASKLEASPNNPDLPLAVELPYFPRAECKEAWYRTQRAGKNTITLHIPRCCM
jgi:hypothetical protein